MIQTVNFLSIGGFDPSCASGVQRDTRVAASLGMYPLCVATTITAQGTSKFGKVFPLDTDTISSQLDSIFSDFEIDIVKVGMLWSSDIMRVVADKISGMSAPIILDPVVKSTTGGLLLLPDAKDTLLRRILPHCFAVTPNLYEAKYLAGDTHDGIKGARQAAKTLHGYGTYNVIVTGVSDRGEIVDVLYDGDFRYIRGERLYEESRGGGCTYSATLACLLARGGRNDMESVMERARKTTFGVLSKPTRAGRGLPVSSEPFQQEIQSAINAVVSMPDMYRLIPQCQTNFAHAPQDAVTPDDIFGLSGRLVRAGNGVVVAGTVVQGGSKHVASAICAIRGRFPQVRSAINIRYSQETLSLLIKAGFTLVFYDRTMEPPAIKESGSSISWGVSQVVASCADPPDAVCHRGDFGKEPMIILFGRTPKEVVYKIEKLFS